MKLISQTKVTTLEEPNRLEFLLVRESGFVDIVVVLISLVGFSYFCRTEKGWWLLVILFAAAIIYTAANSSKGEVSRLTITKREIVITDDVKKAPNRQKTIEAYNVKSIVFSYGGEGDPTGLYINGSCALEGLNREQAEALLNQIFRKFPNISNKDTTPTSLLHGEDSGITTLGLSSTPQKR